MLTEFLQNLIATDKTGHIIPSADPLLAHDQMTLHNLEKYSLNRFRERYSMHTSSIQAFIDYTNSRGNERYPPVTSVDPDTCEAAAIFNATDIENGEPGQCDDTARCTLKPLPMYDELIHISGLDKGMVQKSQRDLIDWIRDWNDYIEEPLKLVTAFSKLTVERLQNSHQEEGDFKAERSAMEQIQVKADSSEVPGEIAITFRPYDGFEERVIRISTSAATDRHDNRVVIRLRPLGFEQLRLTVADEFADKLNDQLSVKPIIGTIRPA